MPLGSPVSSPPNNQSQESQQPRNHKRNAPAPPKIDRQNQERRYSSANRGPAIIESSRQPSFAFRKPFGDRLARSSPVRGFSLAQQEPKQRKAPEAVADESRNVTLVLVRPHSAVPSRHNETKLSCSAGRSFGALRLFRPLRGYKLGILQPLFALERARIVVGLSKRAESLSRY